MYILAFLGSSAVALIGAVIVFTIGVQVGIRHQKEKEKELAKNRKSCQVYDMEGRVKKIG